MERRHRPASDALRDWGLSHRFAGSGDRAAIGNIVYDALRRRRSARWLLDADTARAEALGALILAGSWTLEAFAAQLAGDRFAPAAPDEAERLAVSRRRLEDAPAAVRADVPDWCVPLFEESFGEGWIEEGRAMAARPPLDLRVNTLLADRQKVLRTLAEFGAEPAAMAPQGIRIPPIAGDGRHPNVQAEPAFQQGFFEIQDEGSQIAALLTGAREGETVLDLCAGAGGKTLALAAAMRNTGSITAFDAEKPRLAPIFDRLRRNGVANVEVASRASGLDHLRGVADLVLVDAPCTGSGTWRRRPDAKWRLSQRQLDARMAEQAAILDGAAAFVKPGGRLAYVTCSVFAGENAAQAAAFRGRMPAFHSVDHTALWRNWFPGAEDRALADPRDGIRLSPACSGTDGFYFCLMMRAP